MRVGGWRAEGARGPETDDQAEMLEVFEPLPHPFAHLLTPRPSGLFPLLWLRPGAEGSTYMS